MLASGLVLTPYMNGPVLRYLPALDWKVGRMTCINPTEGWPRAQLMSLRLTAVGLPPLSWFMRRSVVVTRERDWWTSPSAWTTTPCQRLTPLPQTSPPRRYGIGP